MDLQFKKYFTIEEANSSLVLVKQIVYDIKSANEDLIKLINRIGIYDADDSDIVKRKKQEISSLVNELLELGILFKGLNEEIVFIDFPALFDNQQVFLCWKSDEESISYYHPIEKGFAGRMKIPAKYF